MPVLGRKLASPLYSAVIACVPVVRDDVLKSATPLASKATGAPRFVPLSLNCTVPVFAATEVTSALKVTLWFKSDGLTDDDTTVLVLAFAMLNDCGTFAAALKFALPACDAVIVHEPAPVR